jgi:hypothetical protein
VETAECACPDHARPDHLSPNRLLVVRLHCPYPLFTCAAQPTRALHHGLFDSCTPQGVLTQQFNKYCKLVTLNHVLADARFLAEKVWLTLRTFHNVETNHDEPDRSRNPAEEPPGRHAGPGEL